MKHSHLIAILFHCVVDIGAFKGVTPIDKLGQNQAIIPHYIGTLVVSASDHPFSHCCHFAKVQPEHIASPAEG